MLSKLLLLNFIVKIDQQIFRLFEISVLHFLIHSHQHSSVHLQKKKDLEKHMPSKNRSLCAQAFKDHKFKCTSLPRRAHSFNV